MEQAADVLGYINNVLFIALGIVCFREWRRTGGRAAAWAAGTFGLLATISLLGLLFPAEGITELPHWIVKLEVIGIALFPYFLYRFAAAFTPPPRFAGPLALGATLVVAVWTLFLGELPEEGEPRTAAFNAFVIALLVQWSGLLITVAVRLWRAGRGQPTVARRRMRLLSLASAGLTVVLLIAGTGADAGPELSIFTSLLTTASSLAFFFGFAPPPALRTIWRRSEQEAIAVGTRGLMAATSEDEVVESVLPFALQVSGAKAVSLIDRAGRTIGTVGEPPEEDATTVFGFPVASLHVWTTPYTPFFGREELNLLESLGVLINLALERTRLFTSLEEAQRIAHLGSYDFDLVTGEAAWSAELYRIAGFDPGIPLTPEMVQESVHPEDRELTQAATEQAYEQGKMELDYRIVRHGGEVRFVHVRGDLQRTPEGKPLRLTGTVLDVTELRAAERELSIALEREREARLEVERINDEMESFVYTVSHDLNSPLVALLGYLEFLESDHADVLDDRGRLYLERMRASTSYMRALIRDLLELSRVGRVDEQPAKVDLRAVAEEAAESIRATAQEASVTVGDLPVVWVNPVRARQLVTNIMQNSVKYGGREDIGIAITRVAEEDGMVEVSVRDDGVGIPATARERIFGVFERLDREGEEGTGIGLAICKKIVETAGGSIWVADGEGGADLHFTLPLASSREVSG